MVEAPASAGSQALIDAQEEAKKLREENTKLKYRLGFVLRTLDEVEKK